ncbi:MAG: hypothetical protein AMXMBFR46_28620 [Acidimicrobiia bacterium]
MTPVRWLALAAIALFLALPASAAMVLPDLEENPLVPVLDEYYKVPETIQIITVAQNVSHPDDLLVTLFLAHASHKDPVTLNEWRKKSMSWQEIFEKLKLKPSVFFSSLQGVSVPARYQTYVYAQHQYDAWRKHPTAGITLYEATRGRRGELDPSEREILEARYLLTCVRDSERIVRDFVANAAR